MKTKKRRAVRITENRDRSKTASNNNPKSSIEYFAINTPLLTNILLSENSTFFGFVMALCIDMEPNTNILHCKDDTVRHISKKYNIGVNNVTPYIERATNLNIIKMSNVIGRYVFNPLFAIKGNVSDQTILLFTDNSYTIEESVCRKIKPFHAPINDSHNIYILEHKNENGAIIYKIGYSGNIKKRLASYTAHNPTIKLIYSFFSDVAKNLEREIHSKYISIYKNEWYDSKTMNMIINDYKLTLTITQ